MQKFFYVIITLFFLTTAAYADSGIISVKSSHDVKTTADRLESTLKQKGMNVFIRINHAQGAQKIGKELRPTELVIFGNPKVGTPLMQCRQSVAIDLPQKALKMIQGRFGCHIMIQITWSSATASPGVVKSLKK